MILMALGVNYQTASIGIREKLTFDDEASRAAANALLATGMVHEVVFISTCNRTELYCYGQDSYTPLELLVGRSGLNYEQLKSHLYYHGELDAVKHLMRVASGLDSMVLGEVEILGQVKKAYSAAVNAGTVGKSLGRLFQTTFAVAKEVRTRTGIGINPVSVASSAAKLSLQIFSDLQKISVLLVGAGELIRLTVQHLFSLGVRKIMVVNRTQSSANDLALQFGGEAFGLDKIGERLHEADIVITGTAGVVPIIRKEMVERALWKRKRKPMLMVDLSVPRDIQPEVSELEDVYLYSVDDLQEIVEENKRFRRKEAEQAEEMVRKAAVEFMDWFGAQNSFKYLGSFRQKFEQMRDESLQESLHRLKLGEAPEVVLQRLADMLTKRFLHEPSRRLRGAGLRGEERVLELVKALFEDHETLHSK